MADPDNTTQIALGADIATALYGVTGAGEKIGVISDSFNATNGAATDVSNGILPDVTVLSDDSGTDEGRALVEVAYSVASGASYYTANAGTLAQNVTALQKAGCNIIIDDLSVDGEALYQVGSAIDLAIQGAVANNVNYFTAAGNNGNDYYEQGFKPLSTTIAGIGAVTANDFGGGNPYLSLTLPADYETNIQFGWAQPFASIGENSAGAANSLAIYLLDSNGNIVASSTTDDVGGDPIISLYFNNTTSQTAFRLVVVQNGGVVPTGQLFKFFINNDYGTINSPNAGKGSGDLLGHELLPGINVVGAVPYSQTPAYGVSPATYESFSSVGPGEILFDENGKPLSTPILSNEPQFAAPDGSSFNTAGTNGYFSPFYGTSAAAPAAGAVAALALQADGALTTTQITALLAQSLIPVAPNPGFNGGGLIQARAAVELAAADVGDRWKMLATGAWSTAADWSGGAAPTSAQAVSLDDNLGAFKGSYSVIVNAAGAVAGSVAIAAPAGSSATLTITTGGSLTVGGSKAANITAGDFLVSDQGFLNLTGGHLTVTGSLNVNNGTVDLSSGIVAAGDYAQIAGQLAVGDGGTASLTLTDATGFDETGGMATVLAGGAITTTVLTISAALLSDSGKIVDTGALATGASGTPGSIVLEDGGELDIGGATASTSILFAGKALLDFTSTVASTLTLGLDDIVAGFKSTGDAIDFSGLTYNAADILEYAAGTGGTPSALALFDSGGHSLAQINFSASGNYSLASFLLTEDASGHEEIVAANGIAHPDDFNGDATSDLLWTNATSGLYIDWSFVNGVHTSSSTVGTAPSGWNEIGTGDFNGDGTSDILFQNATSGVVVDWDEKNGAHTSSHTLGAEAPSSHWSLAGTGDFNGDGTSDLLWRNSSTGQVMDWTIKNDQVASSTIIATIGAPWTIIGTGDFNDDGTSDILWENTSTKQLVVWEMSNGAHTKSTSVGTIPSGWTYVGNGDFLGNGTDDPLFEYTDGSLVAWKMSNGVLQSGINLGLKVPSGFAVSQIGDFNGDGVSDVMLYNKTTGAEDLGLVNSSGHVSQWTAVGSASPSTWHIAA